MSLFDQRIKDIQARLHKKEISSSDLVEESLLQIGKVEGQIDAFLTLQEDEAREKAKELDDLRANKELTGKLAGIPAGIKDNIMTKNIRTTCASKHLENFIPVYDATVMNKLNVEKAVTIGKLNMDEFAMGSSNENSAFKTTKNPWNTSYVPGGSSGGSAAAVAAGQVFFSLGSDTGGSIREPASFCGVVGMKPTYGRVSRYGLATFASSFDQISPITRTVEDNAYVLQAISGYDPSDNTSANRPVDDFTAALTGDIKGLKIAVPKEFMGQGVDENVKNEIKRSLKVLEDLGAQWEEVTLPHADYATAAYYILSSTEASASLSRFDGVRYGERVEGEKLMDLYTKSRSEGFGDEVKRRIMLGTFASSTGYYDAYFTKAQKVRTLIKQDFKDLFEKYDVILGPTAPTTAFKLGEQMSDPLTMYANDLLTIPVNLAGVPAMSVPTGLVDGLPVGLQIIGNLFDESTIYRTAHAFESANNFTEKPKL